MRHASLVKRFLFVGALSLLLTSCGDGNTSSLTSPTPAAAAPSTTSPSYTLSGTVYAVAITSGTPVEGVLVEETHSHQSAITDARGMFNIVGVSGPVSIVVSKSGYFTQTLSLPAGANNMLLRIVSIPATYTLSGVVSELTAAGQTPVEGVLIEGYRCQPSNCEVQRSTTDGKGLYSISVYAGQNGIWVTKAGYDVDGRPAMPSCDGCNFTVTLDGDTRFDIELVRH